MSKTEEFKRPDHPDFMDSSELKKSEFSGIRHNSITDSAEIWLLGEKVKEVSMMEVNLNPMAIQEALSEVFMLDRIAPDTPEAREFYAAKDLLDNMKH